MVIHDFFGDNNVDGKIGMQAARDSSEFCDCDKTKLKITDYSFSKIISEKAKEYIDSSRKAVVKNPGDVCFCIIELNSPIVVKTVQVVNENEVNIFVRQFDQVKIRIESDAKYSDVKIFKDTCVGYYESSVKILFYRESYRILNINLKNKDKFMLKAKGKKKKISLSETCRICSSLSHIQTLSDYHTWKNTIFYKLEQAFGTESLATALKLMKEYPAAESLVRIAPAFARQILFRHRKNTTSSHKLKKHTTSVYEMLGVPKNIFKTLVSIDCLDVYSLIDFVKDFLQSHDSNQTEKILKYAKCLFEAGAFSGTVEKLPFFIGEGYDLTRLCRYLTKDVYEYQGISSCNEAARLLYDYVSFQKKLNAPYERYPKSLKLYHDIAAKNMKIAADKISRENFVKVVSSSEYKSLEYKGQKYCILAPKEPEDLAKEGSSLCHCVGGYVEYVASRETQIYFMRDNENPDKPLITVEVRNNRIFQARGFSDAWVDSEQSGFLIKWARNKQVDATCLASEEKGKAA